MNRPPRRIVAAVGDLFFTIKITDAVKRAGLEVDFVKTDKDLLEKAKNHPALILLDLSFSAVQTPPPDRLLIARTGGTEAEGA